MNLHQITAIRQAADWIENNPEQYDYRENRIPSYGTPGCALGWIGHFMGAEGGIMEVYHSLGMTNLLSFSCCTMDRLAPDNWRECAADCAKGLRAWADELQRGAGQPK